MRVKDKSCNSPQGLQLYYKETPTQVFSCEILKVLLTALTVFFYGTTPVAAFEVSFSIGKEF